MWLVNYIGFNFIWLIAIFFNNQALPIGIVLLVLHCWRYREQQEILYVVHTLLIGTLIDSTLKLTGVFIFNSSSLLIPLWLMLIWAAFGATLNHSLAFFKTRKIAALITGFIFPPLSYYAGLQFGVVSFGYPTTFTMVLLGIIWAPLFVYFQQVSYEKYNSTPA